MQIVYTLANGSVPDVIISVFTILSRASHLLLECIYCSITWNGSNIFWNVSSVNIFHVAVNRILRCSMV